MNSFGNVEGTVLLQAMEHEIQRLRNRLCPYSRHRHGEASLPSSRGIVRVGRLNGALKLSWEA